MSGQGMYRDRPVRPYVVTRGRARPSRNTIRPETLLIDTSASRALPVSASSEERSLLRMCHRLLSLAEAAAHLGLPVSVVSVVASDLVDAGFLGARTGVDEAFPDAMPPGAQAQSVQAQSRPDRALLQEVLDGLRKLG